MPRLSRSFPFLVLALVPALGLGAQGAPPPGAYALPAEESFAYARAVGDKTDEIEMRMRLVSEEGSPPYVELSSSSEEQEGLYRLDPTTLFATYSDVTTRGKDATIRRVTTVLENRAKPKADEFLVSGANAETLVQELRLFPWGAKKKAKLAFVGSGGGGNFGFELSVTGKEKVLACGRDIECWKAQLGLTGFFGGFVGKTYLWYSVAYPNYLVKSEGPSAGPGSPRSAMLLTSYGASATESASAP